MAFVLNFTRINPNQYKKMRNFQIVYGFANTKFGNCLIGLHGNDVCYVALYDDDFNSVLNDLRNDWPHVILTKNNERISSFTKQIFDKSEVDKPLNVLLKGTNFQCDVWTELAKLQEGTMVCYEDIAKAIGKPNAVRGVANAIAKNKLAYVIPCHRVIRKSGAINKYRWGAGRKELMLKYENSI